MKIWLDDIRKPPDQTYIWVKKAKDAIEIIGTNLVDFISFDHDLGEVHTGYDVAKSIEMGAFCNTIKPLKWDIHSRNPVGSKHIRQAMAKAEEFWLTNRKTVV